MCCTLQVSFQRICSKKIKSWNFRNQFWLPFPSAKWKKNWLAKRRATDRMVGLLLVGLCVLLRLLGERASDRDTRSEESASEESQLRNSTASGDLPLIAFRSILVTLCTPFVEGKLPLGLSCTLPGVIIPGTRVGTVISGWSLAEEPVELVDFSSAGSNVVKDGSAAGNSSSSFSRASAATDREPAHCKGLRTGLSAFDQQFCFVSYTHCTNSLQLAFRRISKGNLPPRSLAAMSIFVTCLSLQSILKTDFLQSCVCMFCMCPTLVVTADEQILAPPQSPRHRPLVPCWLEVPPKKQVGFSTTHQKTPETVLNLHCNASKQKNCTMQSKVQ